MTRNYKFKWVKEGSSMNKEAKNNFKQIRKEPSTNIRPENEGKGGKYSKDST